MFVNCFASCFLIALSFLSLGASAASIQEEPIVAIEPGIETTSSMPGAMGWLDNHTLVVTAQIDSKSQFWERKVMLFNVRKDAATEFLRQASVTCTNSNERIAGVLVGSLARLFAGNSKVPEPELKLYAWDERSGKLSLKELASGDNWNSHLCRKTDLSDVKEPALSFAQRINRYLEEKDGHLVVLRGVKRSEDQVKLIKGGKQVAILAVNANEIGLTPQYLAFRNEYLLAPGRFFMSDFTMVVDGVSTKETPLITMTTAGIAKREFFRPLLENVGFKGDGSVVPYARGALISIAHRPQHSGGIYLNEGKSLKRVWCINKGNEFDRKCDITTSSMSPDGCHFAFFANGSDDAMKPYVYNPTLKILPLCK